MFQGTINTNGATSVTTKSGKVLRMSDSARRSSPTGFGWGYGGSGPFALAHSMLSHLFGKKIADRHAQAFKREVIAGLPFGEGFDLPYKTIRAWMEQNFRND